MALPTEWCKVFQQVLDSGCEDSKCFEFQVQEVQPVFKLDGKKNRVILVSTLYSFSTTVESVTSRPSAEPAFQISLTSEREKEHRMKFYNYVCDLNKIAEHDDWEKKWKLKVQNEKLNMNNLHELEYMNEDDYIPDPENLRVVYEICFTIAGRSGAGKTTFSHNVLGVSSNGEKTTKVTVHNPRELY